MYLTQKHTKQIESRTRRYNPHFWRLCPWEKKGRGAGMVTLYGVLEGGAEVKIVTIPAPSAAMGDAVYHELAALLAARRDWDGIKESTADAEGLVLGGADIDWSKLDDH